MKIDTTSKLLIFLGVSVMLYAQLFMPISLPDAEVANIYLMAERQNTMIFGGFLFVAGIVLFATSKIKQTKEEADQESTLQRERTEQTKALASNAFQKTLGGAEIAAKSTWRGLKGVNWGRVLRVAIGLLVGLLCGVAVYPLASKLAPIFFFETFGNWSMAIFFGVPALLGVLYAFREISMRRFLAHLGFIAVALFAITIVVYIQF